MTSQHVVRIEPLTKENYDTWRIQMEAILIKGDLWEYVSGTKVRHLATNDEKSVEAAAAWDISDRKAKADLFLAISPFLLKDVKMCKTSSEVWRKLQSIHQSRGPARKANLLKQLILNKMSSDGDMHAHILNFFDVVDKLKDMELEINEELLSILLLYSLPDSYENFRIAIESRDELPTAEMLKVKILEEFECRKGRQSNESVAGAMFAKLKRENFSKNGNGNGNSSNRGKKLKQNFKCYRCRRIGHKAAECKTKLHAEKSAIIEEALTVTRISSNAAWCLDSGATSHMCAQKNKFSDLRMITPYPLNLANKQTTQILGTGTVRTSTRNGNNARLENVLYVPDLRTNLLSINKITSKGYKVIFNDDEASIRNQQGETVFQGKKINNLYYILENDEHAGLAKAKNTLKIWHDKMGHLNYATLKDMINKKLALGIKPNTIKENFSPCEICIRGKHSSAPFPITNGKRCEHPLELIHTDICGPMKHKSIGGAQYFATFTDDATRWCSVYMLKSKSEILEKFKHFKTHAENFIGRKIKAIRSDNAKEYLSAEFTKLLNDSGIKHQLSVEYTPQQNGVAERKNRTLVEMARCMILQSKLPASFWGEAIATANYIRNRCPSRSLDGDTPYRLWTGKLPIVSYFQIFGTVAYAMCKGPGRSKFDAKSKKYIFVGYCDESKAYRLWSKENRKILKSRDVIFTDYFEGNDMCGQDFEYTEHNFVFDPVVKDPKSSEEQVIEEVNTDTNNVEKTSECTGNNIVPKIRRLRGRPIILRTGKRGRPKKIYKFKVADEEQGSRGNNNENEENEIVLPESDEDFQDCVSLAVCQPQNISEVITSPYADQRTKAKQPLLRSRSRHIDIRHHFIREAVQDGRINLEYLETSKMPADVLTKALSSSRHGTCTKEIGLKSVPTSG